MPRIRGRLGGKGALGAFGAVRSFMSVVKEIDFDEVRGRAERAPRILVVGFSQEDATGAAERLFGPGPEQYVEFRSTGESLMFDPVRYDAIIVHDAARGGVLDEVRRVAGPNHARQVFFCADIGPDGEQGEEACRNELTEALPDLAPSLGRFFPVFRPAAVRAIMNETAKANGQFALVSNAPAVIPIVGSFVAASADLIVLTKNQIMMCYKIAAIHGRDLGDQVRVIRELVPVVGAGFLWRTIAREAASFIPLAAGTIPKVIIAYAGTLSIGRAADFYYRYGKKPSREQMRAIAQQATDTAKLLPLQGKQRQDNDDTQRLD